MSTYTIDHTNRRLSIISVPLPSDDQFLNRFSAIDNFLESLIEELSAHPAEVLKYQHDRFSSVLRSAFLKIDSKDPDFSHDLSSSFNLQRRQSSERVLSSIDEASIATQISSTPEAVGFLESEGAFRHMLQTVASRFDQRNTNLRYTWVGTVDQATGSGVTFPSPRSVPEQIELLRIYLLASVRKSRLMAAVVAHVALQGIHPFIEANGRTARVLFNLLLNNSQVFYFPIAEAISSVPASYLLKIREAIYFNEWNPVLSFFEKLTLILASNYFAEIKRSVQPKQKSDQRTIHQA
jgi:hypothetical protein